MESFAPEGLFNPIFWSARQAKLEALWDTYYAELLAGKTLVKWEGEGDKAEHEITVHPLRMIAEIEWCLRQIDPAKWGVIIRESKSKFI